MNNCLNCNAPIKQPEGRRPRKFCDNKGKCKGEYHRKLNKKIKEVVPKEKYDEVVKELKELKFAKSVPEKNNHQYPLTAKEVYKADSKPTMTEGESGVDFLIRLNEWKKQNK